MTTGRQLSQREIKAHDYAESVAQKLGARIERPETNTVWLSQKQTDWVRNAHAEARGHNEDYWGHYTNDDDQRFMYHIGTPSPINGCATMTVESPASLKRQQDERERL